MKSLWREKARYALFGNQLRTARRHHPVVNRGNGSPQRGGRVAITALQSKPTWRGDRGLSRNKETPVTAQGPDASVSWPRVQDCRGWGSAPIGQSGVGFCKRGLPTALNPVDFRAIDLDLDDGSRVRLNVESGRKAARRLRRVVLFRSLASAPEARSFGLPTAFGLTRLRAEGFRDPEGRRRARGPGFALPTRSATSYR